MKKSINIKIKILFSAIPFFLKMIKIKRMLKKYKKTPEMVSEEQRYAYLTKVAKKVLKIYNIDLVVKGLSNLPATGGSILVPNHKSYLDVVALMVALEEESNEYNISQRIPVFIAKQELKSSRYINRAMELMDTFLIDQNSIKNSLKTFKEFTTYVKENKRFGIVFPEGERVYKEEVGEYKAGVFKVAAESYMNIIPVTISGALNSFDVNRKGRRTITVNFLREIKARDLITQSPSSVAKRVQMIVDKEIEKYEDS
ncbi:1-acyl-sn-glycerol-3-phosphate acyltransferase [Mycoplasma sp. OR1901]|uniref:lysophospholipid acyltransferase family protein n=1 Tax=Mycoplasma sp. OR1901 TaxID=2742195 RepID=UPI001582F3B4|nr:lysophospholipid acyltransferase family protein [Mycoplasma sp. OR1901]QKT05468.1 1-acyl-sn-glycerol-3-phosphate acyltransferase [Mycoplasma sp. OR1901]